MVVTSAGTPSLRSGTPRSSAFQYSGSCAHSFTAFIVGVVPGRTVLMRTPSPPSGAVSAKVNPGSPAFALLYAGSPYDAGKCTCSV